MTLREWLDLVFFVIMWTAEWGAIWIYLELNFRGKFPWE